MAKQNRLIQRGGIWTFRVRVPDRLRAIVGKAELWKSFGHVSHADASRLARIESVRVDALFADAERRLALPPGAPVEVLVDADLERIARRYFQRLELSAQRVPFSEGDRAIMRDAAEEQGNAIAQSLNDAGLQEIARGIGEEERLSLTNDSPGFGRLVEAVQRALLEHNARQADRADLKSERTYDALFAGVTKSASPATVTLTVEGAVALFKAAPERANVAPKTRAAYEFRYATLMALLDPQKPIGEVTRADLRFVRDTLMKLPPNAQKRFPDMPLQRVATHATESGIAPMSPKSAMLYLHAANALFRWLVNEELAQRNPAAGLKGAPTSEETNRRSFTVLELNALFSSKDFGGSEPAGRNWLYWLPRLALFSGARFSELLALRAADVKVVEGVDVLSLEPNAERALKTRGSRRFVPIHPALIGLGLVEHAKRVPAAGLLFPDAAGPNNMLNARNKEMGRKLRAIFSDTALVFHSFRHTFKDAAQIARIPRDRLAIIGGWEIDGKRTAMDDYGRDPLVRLLAQELSKVSFVGLRL